MEQPEKARTEKAPTILVVEDDFLQRFAVSDVLRDLGFVVAEASNSSEAIDLVGSHGPFDLVITDIMMPGKIDGFGLAAWLKERLPSLPVIVLSANVPSTAPGVDAWLTKPFEPDQLSNEVHRLLAKGQSSRS